MNNKYLFIDKDGCAYSHNVADTSHNLFCVYACMFL